MAKDFEPAFELTRVHLDRAKNLGELKQDWQFEALSQTIRVYWRFDRAQAEAARLNELNADKGAYYYAHHTRVQIRSEDA